MQGGFGTRVKVVCLLRPKLLFMMVFCLVASVHLTLVRKYLTKRVPAPAACGLWMVWMKLWGSLGVSAHKEGEDNQQLPTGPS